MRMRLHGNCFVGVVLTNIFIHLVISQWLPILCNIFMTVVNYMKQVSVTGKHKNNMTPPPRPNFAPISARVRCETPKT